MKSSYELRAKKFIHQIFPYLVENGVFSYECQSVVTAGQNAATQFSEEKKRKVYCYFGSTRLAFITSDYVVKIDYNEDSMWGNSEDELWKWEKIYKKSEYADYFAPISKYIYENHSFYIMPRIPCVGRYDENDLEEDEDFWDWLCDNVRDIHEGQFGMKDGHFVFIDYAS